MAGAALTAFGVFALTACPTVHWLDGGELSAAAFHLVPAHAPGEPFFVAVGRLATLLPLGSIAFRLNLLSAASAASAAALLVAVGLAWTRDTVPDTSRACRVAMVCLGATAAMFGLPIWIQSVRAEVYAPHLALAVAGLATSWRTVRRDGSMDARWGAVSALIWGVDLAVHPLLGVLALVPAGSLAAVRARRFRPRVWLTALVAGSVGWSSYLLLPVRAARHPGFGWGDARTVQGFLDMVLARSFQHNFSPLTFDLLTHNLGVLGRIAWDHVGPAGLLLSALGLVWLVGARRQSQASLAGLLVVFATFSVAAQNKVYGDNPDLLGYMALPIAALWGLAVTGTAALVQRFRTHVPGWMGLAVLTVSALPAVVPALGPGNRAGDYQARMLGEAAFRGLPPGAILVVSGNDTTFVTQYLQEVERVRPDVLIIPRSLVTHPWYRRRLPYPDPVLHTAVEAIGAFARQVGRPVRVELREQDLPDSRHLCPVPAPGWGFYDVRPCPDLAGPPPQPLPGLFRPDRPESSRHALLLGLNAALFLADYYDASGHPGWARLVRERLHARIPSLPLGEGRTRSAGDHPSDTTP